MARKSKAIAKQPKAERAQARNEDNDDNEEVFSQSFKDRLNQFSELSKEILIRKAEQEGNSANQEIRDRRERVSEKVEAASSAILKEELQSLQEWIAEEQKAIASQVNSINDAHDSIKNTLESTNSFSSEEIEQQLQALKDRAAERQAIHDNYGDLLERSKNIYN